jgi:hypothetical protein
VCHNGQWRTFYHYLDKDDPTNSLNKPATNKTADYKRGCPSTERDADGNNKWLTLLDKIPAGSTTDPVAGYTLPYQRSNAAPGAPLRWKLIPFGCAKGSTEYGTPDAVKTMLKRTTNVLVVRPSCEQVLCEPFQRTGVWWDNTPGQKVEGHYQGLLGDPNVG